MEVGCGCSVEAAETAAAAEAVLLGCLELLLRLGLMTAGEAKAAAEEEEEEPADMVLFRIEVALEEDLVMAMI